MPATKRRHESQHSLLMKKAPGLRPSARLYVCDGGAGMQGLAKASTKENLPLEVVFNKHNNINLPQLLFLRINEADKVLLFSKQPDMARKECTCVVKFKDLISIKSASKHSFKITRRGHPPIDFSTHDSHACKQWVLLLQPLIQPTPYTEVDRHAFPSHTAGGGAAPASPSSPRGVAASASASLQPTTSPTAHRSSGTGGPPGSPHPASPRAKTPMAPAAGWESPKQGGSGLHSAVAAEPAGELGIGSQVGIARGWSTNIGQNGLQQLGRFEAVPTSVAAAEALETGGAVS